MLKKLIALCLLVSCASAEQITLGLVTDLSWQGTMAKWTKDQPSSPQPLAWWPMDDDADDYVVIETNGNYTATSSAFTSDRTTSGVLNSALSFNGSDSAISGSADITFSAFTVTAWVKFASFYPWTRVVSKGDGGYSTTFILGQGDGGSIYLGLLDGQNQDIVFGGNAIPIGEWTFIAGTWDGSTATTYLNGAAQVSQATAITPATIYYSTAPFYLGSSADPSQYNLVGDLDEVRIYNTALTANQITNLFTSYNYTPPQPPAQTTISFDATTYYPGDATSDGVYADPTSIQYSGTTFDTISTAYTYGSYTFLEWRDSNGTPYYLNDNLPPDQTTLYAYWY
jgi:hypothetical protein